MCNPDGSFSKGVSSMNAIIPHSDNIRDDFMRRMKNYDSIKKLGPGSVVSTRKIIP